MTGLTYIPIDAAARDGRGLSLRAEDQTLHAGRWHAESETFVYSSGNPINRPITHYLSRNAATAIGGGQ